MFQGGARVVKTTTHNRYVYPARDDIYRRSPLYLRSAVSAVECHMHMTLLFQTR